MHDEYWVVSAQDSSNDISAIVRAKTKEEAAKRFQELDNRLDWRQPDWVNVYEIKPLVLPVSGELIYIHG